MKACSSRCGPIATTIALIWGLLLLGGGCDDPGRPGLDPGRQRHSSTLDPIDFDNCVSQFADALRRWPVVDKADAPIKLAYPEWHNPSGEHIRHPDRLIRDMVRAINLRTGAKVRIAAPGEVGCHYATELSLAPAQGPMAQPVLAMTWSVLRPGTRATVIESIVPLGRKPTRKTTAKGPLPATTRPAGLFGPGPQPKPITYHVIRYPRGRVHLERSLAAGRVTVLDETASRDGDGRLAVELTLLGHGPDAPLRLSWQYEDGSGRRRDANKATEATLVAGRPLQIKAKLPSQTQTYHLYITEP